MNTLALLVLISGVEMDLGIPSGLLKSICIVESGLDPYVVVENDGKGGRSSIGMCQVQQRTAEQFRKGISDKELLDPLTNAYIAGQYLRFQAERYGSWDRSIVAFNRGSSKGPLTQYHAKVVREWRINGGNKKANRRLSFKSTKWGNNAATRVSFLREDYAYAD